MSPARGVPLTGKPARRAFAAQCRPSHLRRPNVPIARFAISGRLVYA
jgi:hypothetical protein